MHKRSGSGRRGGSNDVRYFPPFIGPQLRPNARMPLEAHRQCGGLLKQLVWSTEGRPGAHSSVADIRCTLDDWVMREYDHSELDGETLSGLYYPGPSVRKAQLSREDVVGCLGMIKEILEYNYPDGVALRKMSRLIDRAIRSIATWDGKPRGKILRR